MHIHPAYSSSWQEYEPDTKESSESKTIEQAAEDDKTPQPEAEPVA